MTIHEIRISLRISSEQFTAYYRGTAKHVNAVAIDGRRVQFPAAILQPFLTKQGIDGLFALRFDENNKFIDIQKLT